MSPAGFRSLTPRDRGFRWPAEWEAHEATLLAWPHDESTWPGGLEHAEGAMAAFAAAVSRGETVHLLVNNAAMETRARKLLAEAEAADVELHRIPTADVWLRDYGPITLVEGDAEAETRLCLAFTFNAWGGKYPELFLDDGIPARLEPVLGLPVRRELFVLEGGSIEGNGRGTLLTTEQCLLNPNRNPGCTREEIETRLRECLNVDRILWLGAGVAGDDTDGHVDDVARFVGPRSVVAAMQPDPNDPDHAPLSDNRQRLAAMTDEAGRPLEVIELPMPAPVCNGDGDRLPASHANFYVCNAAVCVPTFGGASDEAALKILARCFPGRAVVPIRCERFVEGFGTLHCVSQQIPR